MGATYLDTRGFFTDSYWYWTGFGALVGFVFLLNMLFGIALAILGPFDKPQANISDDSEADAAAQEVELPRIGETEIALYFCLYHSYILVELNVLVDYY